MCVDVAQYQGASSLEERGQQGGEVRGAATAGGMYTFLIVSTSFRSGI